jgi:hypothetical protein
LHRIKRIEQQAKLLIEDADFSTIGNMQGYMLAGLAFLEKNKKFFPETHERAKKLCEIANCTDTGYMEGLNSLDQYNRRMQQGSRAINKLIEGVSSLGVEE